MEIYEKVKKYLYENIGHLTTAGTPCWRRSKSAKSGAGGSLRNRFWTHHSLNDSLEKRRDSPYS